MDSIHSLCQPLGVFHKHFINFSNWGIPFSKKYCILFVIREHLLLRMCVDLDKSIISQKRVLLFFFKNPQIKLPCSSVFLAQLRHIPALTLPIENCYTGEIKLFIESPDWSVRKVRFFFLIYKNGGVGNWIRTFANCIPF